MIGGATSGSSGTEHLHSLWDWFPPCRPRTCRGPQFVGDAQLHLVERRVDLLAAVADALDDLADRIRADAVLPRNVIDFVRFTSGDSGAIRFSALPLTVGHLLLLCLNSLQQLKNSSTLSFANAQHTSQFN